MSLPTATSETSIPTRHTSEKGRTVMRSFFDDSEKVLESLDGLTSEHFSPLVSEKGKLGLSRPSLSYWKDAWRRLKKNRQAIVSLYIVVGLVLFTLAGPLVWTKDASLQTLGRISEAPSLASKQVKVLPELTPYQPLFAEGFPAEPAKRVYPEDLPAPAGFRLLSDASTQAVRLSWSPVTGATGYRIYRGTYAPLEGSLGLPIATLDGGHAISVQDLYSLTPGTLHYAIVALSGDEESPKFASLEVKLEETLALSAALKIDPKAEAGQTLSMPVHPLGTDYLGRDLLARLMKGARISLFIGFVAPFFSLLIGVLIGGISGYFGGKVDAWIMRFTDFVLALPFLLFMILFKVAFGAGPGEDGIGPMLIAMVALSWTGPARLTRGQILQLRESEFVQASRLLGAKPMYLIIRHLLPNTLGVILVSLTFAIPSAIFTEAFLSFIGMGVVPPTPSWGSMCNDGIQIFLTHPHEFIFPALLISITVLAFNLLGDGLRDALDPKMRSVS